MRNTIRLLLAASVVGVLGLVPGAASANVLISPTSIHFPDQTVHTKSASVAVTLTKNCAGAEDTQCFAGAEGPTYFPEIGITGEVFGQTNNCPTMLTATLAAPTPSCTISVFMNPYTAAHFTGTLITGTGGPKVALDGTGVAAPKKCKKAKKKKKKPASDAKAKKCKKKKKK